MAKYETRLYGSFDAVLDALHDGIMNASATASFEDESFCTMGNTRVAMRVYERYSAMGSNRVSMAVTLAGNGEDLFLSAITSGGSQAMFFKVNTFGESSFLDTLIAAAEGLK